MKINIFRRFLQGLLAVLCLLWIIFGIIYIVKLQTINPQNWVILILMILNSFCFGTFVYLTRRKSRIVYIFLILFLVVNTILTITDQIGIFDWIIFFINLVAVTLSVSVIVYMSKNKIL